MHRSCEIKWLTATTWGEINASTNYCEGATCRLTGALFCFFVVTVWPDCPTGAKYKVQSQLCRPKVWKRSSPQPGPFSTGWLLWAYARMHRVVAWGSGIVYWTLSPISMYSHQPPGAIEEQASYGSSRSPLMFIFLQNVCSLFSMWPIAAIDTVDEALIFGGLAHGRWFYESFVSLKETKVSRWQT